MPNIKTTLARDIEAETLDIRFTITLPGGSKTKTIINIEAQRKSNPGYSLLNRGIFYAARLISAQLSVEFTNDGSDKEQYDNIKKVYSIWICMDCPEDKNDSIINYSFEPHIIYQGNNKLKLYPNCDLMNITFIHLSGKPDQSHHQLISMLDTLLAKMDAETKKKKLQGEHNLPMTIKLEKEMNDMCNVSSGIREEGIREGEVIGIHKGRLETTINNIRNLMHTQNWSAEKAMSALGFDASEYPKYLALLQN